MKVLKADCGAGDAYADIDLSAVEPAAWFLQADFWIPAATFTALAAKPFSAQWLWIGHTSGTIEDSIFLTGWDTGGGAHNFSSGNRNYWTNLASGNPVSSSFTPDAWHTVAVSWDGATVVYKIDGSTIFSYATTFPFLRLQVGGVGSNSTASEIYYLDNVRVGTAAGLSDIFNENFEDGTFAAWDSTSGGVSIIDDPLGTGGPSGDGTSAPSGRVSIAFDDGPLEPNPTWTVMDQGGDLPVNFVSGYDITTGRQSLISQTDTGTATVYINDRDGLFDDRNLSSPYVGKLSGRQILLQLYDPVRAVWEEQFRGLIDDYSYDIDGSAVNASGEPINASIQLECVDVFDYLAGFGLTPGLAGVDPAANGDPPPAGSQATIYYAETAGSVQDRVIQVLAEVGIDTSMYVAASGNVRVQAAKYDPDEPALTVLRDCADAELPFIGLHYCNRHGQYVWRGRYSRFYPDDVAAEPGSEWDFHRWAVGDGPAIQSDPTRAQMRVLSYARSRSNIINAALAYPQGIKDADMPGQVFANVPSIDAYGKHTPPGPLSDLLTLNGTVSGNDANTETALYAELLVKNQKDPRVTLTALQLKSINPTDPRASVTWALMTQCDISDVVNVAVGYPGGTGFTGDSPQDDYYIEGRHMTVRPANTGYDYVELNLEVSAAVWSMDTHGVFPNPFA